MTRAAVCDFSFARPTGDELRAAGITGAGVYVGTSRPTLAEIAGWRDAGIDLWLIFEVDNPPVGYYRITEGEAAGRLDAVFADRRADEIGYPLDAAIYYCAGDTPNPPATREQIHGYKTGLVATSRRPIGFYGGGWVLDRLDEIVPLTFRWKVETWGVNHGIDHLLQMPNSASGIDAVDADDALVADYGQWRANMNPTDEELEMYVMRCEETQQVAVVTEFRVAAYPIPEWTGRAPDVICTKVELDTEIAARQALAASLGKVDGGQVPPFDLGPVRTALVNAAGHLQNVADVAGIAARDVGTAVGALPHA